MQEKHDGVQQDLLMSSPAPAAVRTVSASPESAGTQGVHSESHAPNLLGACPDCGSQLEFAEGCVKCHVCGYSECG